jgi:arylsulfatase
MDWFPTFCTAAGNPNIITELLAGKSLNGTTYKVHLDGYDQTELITSNVQYHKGARNEFWYFTESELAAARIGDYKYTFLEQPDGWFGPKVKLDWPGLRNIRLDPFEKMSIGQSLLAGNWWAFEFWRFVFIQQEVGKLAMTALDYPPMQKGASFNLSVIKEKIEKAMASRGSTGN